MRDWQSRCTLHLTLSIILGLLSIQAYAGQGAEASCPVTVNKGDDIVGPAKAPDGMAWFGNDQLAAVIPQNGHWIGMGPEYNFRDKLWWWSDLFDLSAEKEPELAVVAKRLDGSAPDVRIAEATNAIFAKGSAMLVGIQFPTEGCWRVTGEYKGEALSFVVLVGT